MRPRRLLGAHVAEGADRKAAPRQGRSIRQVLTACGHPEVRHDREALGEQDVLGLHVPVHDSHARCA